MNYANKGDTFVDVGANIGWHTLLMSEPVGESGTVHPFEPSPSVRAELMHNLQINAVSNCVVHECGLGRHRGEVSFQSFDVADVHAGDGYVIACAEGMDASVIQVPVVRLDDLEISRCQLLKIDVEGFEAAVLDGATKTLSDHRPVVLFESISLLATRVGESLTSIRNCFADLNYDIYQYDDRNSPSPVHFDQNSSGDFIAIPR